LVIWRHFEVASGQFIVKRRETVITCCPCHSSKTEEVHLPSASVTYITAFVSLQSLFISIEAPLCGSSSWHPQYVEAHSGDIGGESVKWSESSRKKKKASLKNSALFGLWQGLVNRRVFPLAKSQWSSCPRLPCERYRHNPFISETCTPPLCWCTFAWPKVSSETFMYCLNRHSSGSILTECYSLKTSSLQRNKYL
jgi:hypothetical protein